MQFPKTMRTMKWIVLFIILISTKSIFASEDLFKHRISCGTPYFSDSDLTPVSYKGASKVTERTGIRIMELTKAVQIPYSKTTLVDVENVSRDIPYAKVKFSNSILDFLQIFPLDFLKFHRDLCIVVIKQFTTGFLGFTMKNVIVVPSDVSVLTVAHELMHAIDNTSLNLKSVRQWRDIDEKYNCIETKPGPAPNVNSGYSIISPCFASPYGGGYFSEDRAEIFALMISDYYHFFTKVPANSALEEKVKTLKSFLNKLWPDFNESFWYNHSGQHKSWRD